MRLDFYLNPKSIVFMGISNKPKSKKILENLLNGGYLGRIFVVNKDYKKISNFISYSNVLNIPSQIDVALVFNPIEEVPQILKDCAQKKIKHIILFSNFDKNNNYHLKVKNEILEIIKKLDISILGPEYYGIINLVKNVKLLPYNFNFEKGKISVISFSTPTSVLILDLLNSKNVGISKFVNFGLDWNNNLINTLEYLEQDNDTKAILLTLEKEFITNDDFLTIQKISYKKPLIIYSPHQNVIKILEKTNSILTADFNEYIYLVKLISFYPYFKNQIFNIISNNKFLTYDLINKFKKNNLFLSPIKNNPKIVQNLKELENYRVNENTILLLQPQENVNDLKINLLKIINNWKRKNIFICLIGGKLINSIRKNLDNENIPYFEDFNKLISVLNKIFNYYQNIKKIRSQTKLFVFKKKDKLFY